MQQVNGMVSQLSVKKLTKLSHHRLVLAFCEQPRRPSIKVDNGEPRDDLDTAILLRVTSPRKDRDRMTETRERLSLRANDHIHAASVLGTRNVEGGRVYHHKRNAQGGFGPSIGHGWMSHRIDVTPPEC